MMLTVNIGRFFFSEGVHVCFCIFSFKPSSQLNKLSVLCSAIRINDVRMADLFMFYRPQVLLVQKHVNQNVVVEYDYCIGMIALRALRIGIAKSNTCSATKKFPIMVYSWQQSCKIHLCHSSVVDRRGD